MSIDLVSNESLTHSTAHYLLTVHKLAEVKERSRLIDIARELSIARSSATIAVRRLKEKGLVEEDVKHNLLLTDLGHHQVHEILSNRTLLFYFFKDVLGVSSQNAEHDACEIEHLISSESQEKLFSFMKNISSCDQESKISKVDMDLCLCDYEGLADFKEKQEGGTFLVKK